MNYSTGCAFNVQQLLYNLNRKKLTFKAVNKFYIACSVFIYSVQIILNDIIDNNITFNLPTGARKCNIHMHRVQGNDFKNLRKSGKWADVDIISSYFTGYEINIYMQRRTHVNRRIIYVDKNLKNRITENTNNGKQYGDSCSDKVLSDYYKIVMERFPKINKNDIKYILNFAWKSVYLHLSYGGDICISNKNLWVYIGNMQCESLEHFDYYRKKLAIKIRVLHKKKKIPWDGYYYFALYKSQYDKIFGNTKKRGRPKTRCIFENVFMYEILDECLISDSNAEYVFKIPYVSRIQSKFYLPILKTNKAKLIMIRKPLKFKDILVSSNKYDCI